MKKNITKNLILEACLEKQEELIAGFERRVNETRADAYERQESDSQSENRTPGKIELLSKFQSELEFAKLEMEYLKTLDAAIVTTVVQPGAVVVTNLRTFFIGVSSEKIDIDGDEVFGISTKAPIYAVMQGLEKGGSFEYNDTAYTLKNVY
ncbi:MAG: hypothetical protein ABJB11_11355 [Ferruginibacter sp.]